MNRHNWLKTAAAVSGTVALSAMMPIADVMDSAPGSNWQISDWQIQHHPPETAPYLDDNHVNQRLSRHFVKCV
jgi:hypothetical protein